jgi:hypothetical protein
MYEVTQMVRLHSLSVSLNHLPPLNPNSNRESVARVNFTISLGDGSFITHRGVHLIKVNNGGMYLSSPGKRRQSDNSYMEYASLTGPLMEAVRSEATAEYRRLRVAADATERARQGAVAEACAVPAAEQRPLSSRIADFNALWAEIDRLRGEFAMTNTDIILTDEGGTSVSKAESLAMLVRGEAPQSFDVILKVDADSSTLLSTHVI